MRCGSLSQPVMKHMVLKSWAVAYRRLECALIACSNMERSVNPRNKTMLRLFIGISILLFGVIAFAVAITSMPPGASFKFTFGMTIPSGTLITAGILILAFRRGSSATKTKKDNEEA